MKLLQFMCLGITLFVLIHNATGQDFQSFPGLEIIEPEFDNRSIAMGKTAITTARGSSAIFSNPSILATFSEPQIQVGGKLLYGTATDEALSERYDSYDAGYSVFPSRSYLALAVPYRLSDTQVKLVFGVGYQRNEGIKLGEEVVQFRDEWSVPRQEEVKIRVTTNTTARAGGYLSTLTPGVALNFQDKYFLGVTFNRTLGALNTVFERKSSDSHRKTDAEREQSALFLRLGAFAEVTPELSVGLMYRPEFDWEWGETIAKITVDGDLDTTRDQDHIELTMPAMWGIGVEYEVNPELVIAAEVQYRPFSDLQWSEDFVNQPIIDDGFNVAAGAEYLGFDYPVRIGVFRDLIPVIDDNDTDPIGMTGITAGIGSVGEDEDFSWNISGIFGRWERVTNDDGQKYAENLIRSSISVTYRFDTNFVSSFIR